ncbi:Vegetative incompatibility protein HET-E-1 [Colletotrichum siamense]|nr:Vegetative incompatibility protein HET-E-1 [Colletotrichum siamense]
MAEAFAALGIAANIFQFLELGFKTTQTIIKTYRDIDIDGLAQRNAKIALTCSDFEEHCSRLKNDKPRVKDDPLGPLLTRCINTATKLSTEIGRLKVPDSKRRRRRTKAKIAVISYWKGSTIESLQADLVDIRGQICFRLQGLIYEHHRALAKSVDTWGEASKDWNRATEQKLNAMAQQVEELLKSEPRTEYCGFKELVQTLAAFAEEARNHGINRAILESLHFAQIKERQNEIPKAHKNTFKWIFNDNGPGNFANWLRESSGIFWITGKPGSGKSTLMKFISGHETTKDLATTWASPKPLLLASHFFWFGGSKLQKSQEGLLRTLLFQILSNTPQLIREVFPDRISGQFQYLESWSLEELSDAFERIQALPTIPCRIFVFVDGLDEFSGQGTEVTEFLHAITKSPEIKVCCASRPWQEFRNSFRNVFGQIQMHDLTSADMRVYVQSTLRQIERFKKLQSSQETQEEVLIDSICTKAEGVFFWVSLVVKSLVRGLNNGDGLETLQRRVSEFPPDLERFFKRMVDSIEEVYKNQVDRVFSMLLMVHVPLPLLLFRARHSILIQDMESQCSTSFRSFAVSRMEERIKMRRRESTKMLLGQPSPLFYQELETGDPGISKTITDDLYGDPTGLLLFNDQLLSRCRDLVQAWQVNDLSYPYNIQLGFLHRTVVEFLQNRENRRALNNGIHLDRYFLARSCLSVLSIDTSYKAVNRDFLLWFLYILQETNATTDHPGHNDGYMLLTLCGELIDILKNQKSLLLGCRDDSVPGVLRLLALCRARILIEKHQAKLRDPRMNYNQYHEDRNGEDILQHVLQGSGRVEVGNRPREILSDSIDLELLENLLQMNGVKKHIIPPPDSKTFRRHSVWETFIASLVDLARAGPRNGYEACEIMIKNGAAKSLKLNDEEDVDVIQYLRENNAFTEDEIGALETLFPPEMSASENTSKKKRRKRAYRKGRK